MIQEHPDENSETDQQLIARLSDMRVDHDLDGYPAITMGEILQLLDYIKFLERHK